MTDKPYRQPKSAPPWAAWLLLAVGLFFIAAGLLWKHLASPQRFWSDSQAQAYAAAAEAVHAATIHGAPSELQSTRTRFAVLSDELSAAQAKRLAYGRTLTIAGVLAVAGSAWWLRRYESK